MIVYLTKREVTLRTGLSDKKLDELVQSGLFPRSIPTTGNHRFWSLYEIEIIATARSKGALPQEVHDLVRALEQARGFAPL